MPLLEKLRRPATSTSTHPRPNTSADTGSQPSPSKSDRGHKKIGSLQRLSLSFPQPDGATFGGFLTQEPEEMERGRSTAQEEEHETQQARSPQTSPTRLERKSFQTTASGEAEEAKVKAHSSPRPTQRFSLLKFRHASDPQLSSKYKVPPSPSIDDMPTPRIITTAPTSHQLDEEPVKKKSKTVFGRSLSPFRKSQIMRAEDIMEEGPSDHGHGVPGPAASAPNLREHKIHFQDQAGRESHEAIPSPPAYGDESTSSLAIPISRLSESGGSEGSSGSHKVYAQTTTTHTISTTTTFFKLKRKKKEKGPLFPLPERLVRPTSARMTTAHTTDGIMGRRSMSPSRSTQAVRFEPLDGDELSPMPSPTHSMVAITNAPLGSPGPAISRQLSVMSTNSASSIPSVTLVPPRLGARGRSSTMGSLRRSSDRDGTLHQPPSGRTSTSTNGRRSFGDILTFSHRLRQNSGPPRNSSTNSPSTPGSKSNSMQIARDAEPELIYPLRDESDTPASYLEKLEAAVSRGLLATILCKSADEFAKTCLRKYMRGFSYFQESIDMSIRKMLMEVELPKETQQIDRLLAAFADRYHECNPGIFKSADEASIIAFSILLLHSDNHNKNNKRKMQKADYVKNTQHGQVQIAGDVLECFYDNICYTPFIHFEDEIAINSHRLSAPKQRKSLIKTKSTENIRGPVDPYTLILDNKLEALRPSLKDVIDTEDVYSSTGTTKDANPNEHHKSFVNSAVLQIVSARSRPDAFMTQATITNPAEAQAGLVSIKIAKVGLLWRKDQKKKKAKRPWQEWGAVLTDSKLYFFKDIGWVKKLIAQHEAHSKTTGKVPSLIFKPPLTSFEPDALMAMDDAVALMDVNYKKHKNAFTFIKHGGFEEVFLANSESEMNDWIAKLNYAATFRTAGVRMRGLLGTNYEGRRLLRKDSELSTASTDLVKESNIPSSKADTQMAWEILFYRHQLIQERISGLEEKLLGIRAELDQLLRNARHLLLLLPIQGKTREALVFAAGRMSAKLKWTRVELWRTQTHTDILKKDLEAEGNVTTFPSPQRGSIAPAPLKVTTPQRNAPTPRRVDTGISDTTLSPSTVPATPTGRRPSQTVLNQIRTSDSSPEEQLSPRTPGTSPTIIQDQFSSKQESNPVSNALQHQSSVVSSHRSRQEPDWHFIKAGADDGEDRALRDAGLVGLDGEVQKDRLRRGSESEKDRVGANSPVSDGLKDRGTSVRKSLQRTLRDVHHHTPSHHRRRGKESGSSSAAIDDNKQSVAGESVELKRGTGSFILHGKKASVITMSPEWSSLSNEERMKGRKAMLSDEKAVLEDGEEAFRDATVSEASIPSTSNLSSPVREDFVSASSSRKASFTSTVGEAPPEEKERHG